MKTWKQLEQFILDAAPPHYASDNAPSTYRGLRVVYGNTAAMSKPMPVYGGECHNTIWSSPEVNLAFRAWHDEIHVLLDYDFSMRDEMLVARQHIIEVGRWSRNDRFDNVLWCEIAGQRLFYEMYRQYVPNQNAFVCSLLKHGVVIGDYEYMQQVITSLYGG